MGLELLEHRLQAPRRFSRYQLPKMLAILKVSFRTLAMYRPWDFQQAATPTTVAVLVIREVFRKQPPSSLIIKGVQRTQESLVACQRCNLPLRTYMVKWRSIRAWVAHSSIHSLCAKLQWPFRRIAVISKEIPTLRRQPLRPISLRKP